MIKSFKKNIFVLLALALSFSPVLAYDKLPEPMVGQTTVQTTESSSLKFDGKNYVQIPTIANLASSNFTVMFWIKSNFSNNDINQTIVSAGRLATDNTCNSTGAGWAVGIVQNTIKINFCNGTSIAVNATSTISDLNNNSWHHVAITRDSSGSVKIYHNGALKDHSISGPNGSLYNSTQPITVGAASSGFTATVDEARLYDAVLTPSFISWSASSIDGSSDYLSANLQGWWSFDEGGISTTALDKSTYHRNGTLKRGDSSNLPTWNSFSVFGDTNTYYGGFTGNEAVLNYNSSGQTAEKNLAPSLKFDGDNDYVDYGTGPAISGTGGFTVSAWVKYKDFQAEGRDYGNIISQRGTTTVGQYWLYLRPNGELAFVVNGGGDDDYQWSNSSIWPDATISVDAWHHVVAIRKNDGTGQIWVDGVMKSQKTSTQNVDLNNTNHVNTGIDLLVKNGKETLGQIEDQFKGNIDDTRIYNRALANNEIQDLYKGKPVSDTELKGLWDFSDGSGPIVHDKSGNGNDGTLNNFAFNASSGWDVNEGSIIRDDQESLFGFDQDNLVKCVNGIVTGNSLDNCFISNNINTNGIRVMNSKTYAGGNPAMELATLLYPSKTVIGDVYGSLSNFAFWGKSVNQGSGVTSSNSDAAYRVGYAINPSAQAKWDGAEFTKNDAKIDVLKGEAPTLTSASIGSIGTWYMQSTTNIGNSDQSDASKTPEGKVWYVNGNLTISNDKTYRGKGTIIVNGNLIINSGVDIQPYASGQNRLGFIVIGSGNVTAAGNNKINTTIYCRNTFNVNGSNNTFIGSFVANAFGGLAGSNIRFYYDYAFDEAWPPGFKYLNMPHAEVK